MYIYIYIHIHICHKFIEFFLVNYFPLALRKKRVRSLDDPLTKRSLATQNDVPIVPRTYLTMIIWTIIVWDNHGTMFRTWEHSTMP